MRVTFNAESREYNEKWYTDLRAVRIDQVGGSSSAPTSSAPSQSQGSTAPRQAPPVADLPSFSADDQDLPF